jgi:tetratricopeptide (TPR) repeat protein/tRNA A-37 threonylcarbamoyl transferase component Bud32
MSSDADRLSHVFRLLEGRFLLGQLALLNGLITDAQLRDTLARQRTDPEKRPLGTLLFAGGLVSRAQLEDLLEQQRQIHALEGAGPDAPSPDAVQRMVGHYALTKQIGVGGAGVVWKAWDTRLYRWVALKEPKPDAALPSDRFLREARAAAKLRHPALIEALEVGEHDGRPFLVMTYVDGKPLGEANLGLRRSVEILAEIADAVHLMHSRGLLHRDIKPENILVDTDGRGYLGDFGLAKDLSRLSPTVEGSLMGTPLYMAPEQAMGELARIGPSTDIYALGATLYHLATGRPPFAAGDDLQTLVRKLASERPAAPREIAPSVPAELEAVILRALEKSPSDRYASAADFGADLRRFLAGEPVIARPPHPVRRTMHLLRRKPGLAAAALIALASVALMAWSSHARGIEERYRAAYQDGIDSWMRAVGHVRGAQVEVEGLTREAEGAVRAFDEAARLFPSRPEPWLMRGRCLMLLRRRGDAESSWTEAISRDPAFGPALLERGKVHVADYIRLRLPPVMRRHGTRVRFGAPEPESEADRERRRRGERDLEAARKAPGLHPVELKAIEGALAFGQGRYSEALPLLREVAAHNPSDVSTLGLYAAACSLTGDVARAEEPLTRAIALEPGADAYKSRGDVRLCLGRAAEAAEDYGEALRREPRPAFWCNRGLAFQSLRKLAEAIADYSKAIELDPRFARAYVNRGTAKVEQGDLEGAAADFSRALDLDDFYAEAYNNLGGVLLHQKKVEEAIAQYGLAIQCHPGYAEAYANRGLAFMKLAEFAKAAADFEAALRIDPDNADVLLDLALAFRAHGDLAHATDKARRALEVAAADWPRRAEAEKALRAWAVGR